MHSIPLPFLVCKIFTFYINDVLLFKCPFPGPKGLLTSVLHRRRRSQHRTMLIKHPTEFDMPNLLFVYFTGRRLGSSSLTSAIQIGDPIYPHFISCRPLYTSCLSTYKFRALDSVCLLANSIFAQIILILKQSWSVISHNFPRNTVQSVVAVSCNCHKFIAETL